MHITLDPPRGIADVTIGMDLTDAGRVLAGLPGYLGPGRAKGGPVTARFSGGMTVQAHDDGAGKVEAVEVYRPTDPTVHVVYGGISVFGAPADRVQAELAARLDLVMIDDGSTLVAPDLFLALGRSLSVYGDPVATGFFESVVVAAPGYYDDLEAVDGPHGSA